MACISSTKLTLGPPGVSMKSFKKFPQQKMNRLPMHERRTPGMTEGKTFSQILPLAKNSKTGVFIIFTYLFEPGRETIEMA